MPMDQGDDYWACKQHAAYRSESYHPSTGAPTLNRTSPDVPNLIIQLFMCTLPPPPPPLTGDDFRPTNGVDMFRGYHKRHIAPP